VLVNACLANRQVQDLLAAGEWTREQCMKHPTVVGNDHNDVVDFLKLPHVPYEQQIELLNAWLTQERSDTNDKGEEAKFTYDDAVRGDSTGQGDMPMECPQAHTHLPVGPDSHVTFTLQSKNELYLNFESVIYREQGDSLRFTWPAIIRLLRSSRSR